MERRGTTVAWLLLGLFIAATLLAGPHLPLNYVARINLFCIAVMSAAALNLLTGNAGQVSLGQAAFLAIGAYTAVFVQSALGLGMVWCVAIAACVSALVGLIVGIPSLRFRGFYLALTTLALHFIVIFVATRLQVAYGGLAGFRLPQATLGSIEMNSDLSWYYLLVMTATTVLICFHNIARSKVGRAWTAVRDRDMAASIIGIDVMRYKLIAFVVSSLVTGAVGVLQAFYISNVAVETYSLDLAIAFVAMIVIGGLGSVWGSILGALAVTQLPLVVQATAERLGGGNMGAFSIYDYQVGAYGLIIILFLIVDPDGLVGLAKRARLIFRSAVANLSIGRST